MFTGLEWLWRYIFILFIITDHNCEIEFSIITQCLIFILASHTHALTNYNVFDLVLWHINNCWLFNAQILFIPIFYIYTIWVLWHINSCKLFNSKSSWYMYIKYIGFGWVGFYSKSTIVGYLMPKSSLYKYFRYIWFGLVRFYGISTLVGYLMTNPLDTYILDI